MFYTFNYTLFFEGDYRIRRSMLVISVSQVILEFYYRYCACISHMLYYESIYYLKPHKEFLTSNNIDFFIVCTLDIVKVASSSIVGIIGCQTHENL